MVKTRSRNYKTAEKISKAKKISKVKKISKAKKISKVKKISKRERSDLKDKLINEQKKYKIIVKCLESIQNSIKQINEKLKKSKKEESVLKGNFICFNNMKEENLKKINEIKNDIQNYIKEINENKSIIKTLNDNVKKLIKEINYLEESKSKSLKSYKYYQEEVLNYNKRRKESYSRLSSETNKLSKEERKELLFIIKNCDEYKQSFTSMFCFYEDDIKNQTEEIINFNKKINEIVKDARSRIDKNSVLSEKLKDMTKSYNEYVEKLNLYETEKKEFNGKLYKNMKENSLIIIDLEYQLKKKKEIKPKVMKEKKMCYNSIQKLKEILK